MIINHLDPTQISDLSSDIRKHGNLQHPDVLVDRVEGSGWRESTEENARKRK
jgi:hypothetical protein